MMNGRQEIWIDFGLSGLTKWFHGPLSMEMSERDLVAAAADWGDGSYAPTLLEDVLRLLESPLSTEAIDMLWCAATGRSYAPDRWETGGRDWLREVARVCVERIRQDDPAFEPGQPGPVPNGLGEDVLSEIRSVRAALEAATIRDGIRDVVPTLEQVVTQVDPDLGFRLFLRVMKAYRVPIGETQHDRYHELGETFGYNEFVVDDGDLYVGPGME
ncbi:hypothetical protein [Streptomyces sp. CBMA152]|uniref:hypothetical protein n=1 Tax=Streptomyces sp. CBMA152 TaxID=1896312 RepID=UPI001CB71D69|nr:hypothetical protein [Streptomyces sp. CBMA152]MBD0744858.1 hypothetical protein [Streptomyces sp. CBMA152]